MIEVVHKLLLEVDVVVGYNQDKFDFLKFCGEFLLVGFLLLFLFIFIDFYKLVCKFGF